MNWIILVSFVLGCTGFFGAVIANLRIDLIERDRKGRL